MNPLTKLVVKYLRERANALDNGTSYIDKDTSIAILGAVAHIALSKEEACEYLNMSRSNFDLYVYRKIIPKGRKIPHKNKLIWYQDELDIAVKKYKGELTY
jgi:predicted DNA-binding transcriptional regulator AlpA